MKEYRLLFYLFITCTIFYIIDHRMWWFPIGIVCALSFLDWLDIQRS